MKKFKFSYSTSGNSVGARKILLDGMKKRIFKVENMNKSIEVNIKDNEVPKVETETPKSIFDEPPVKTVNFYPTEQIRP